MQQTILSIESLDAEARGIGHLPNEDGTPGKVVFVEGALPRERVEFSSYRKKPNWEAAKMMALHKESSERVNPKCHYFGTCGGCSMQHLDAVAQVAMKQRILEDNLKHIGKVKPETMLRPVHGPTWGYRYRARISVRNVPKKGGVLVGFHERKSIYVTDMKSCEVLPPHVSAMLVPLRALIASLSITDQLPQIELAIGHGLEKRMTAMVLRIMAPLTTEDEEKLKAFADRYQIHWWLQPAGPDSAYQYYPQDGELHYTLPEFGIRMPFKPTDFTQVNHQINRVLVARALRLLDVQPHERVADLFCGLGNFTLPIATQASEVVGIEGSTTLTERALENARANGVETKTSFFCRNLFEAKTEDFVALGKFDRMLIDPPRDGAQAVCEALVGLGESHPDMLPKRIVYVSCSPSTLARDAAILVNQGRYVLKNAGVVNMFPHTSHVESMGVFELRND
ncbi:MAG: 23S rRNA (uracil(1939)-C(5))-methyltransferase RlmD [Oxalicibacterium faecigallinarum]|uniref:23S rRNA (uracil(1939)-C(5))-methyltransferase RlmD n=1 Tax=Oxalicibacterium faecigallinarum TaxID=573741 RepID=UPI002809EB52|nr:23S rRNA (uracil(1939)-C(5))-methyltransferase RlmD [Oxalicibacterium faecigallinarum]MDQ7968744.1 23S rRNA (uracil(1939)-C(5))-methyltransferase RlmD [Oxalicibacterium faecigallinarum]